MMSEKEIIDLLLDENINNDDKDKFLDEIRKHPKINDLKRIVNSLSKLNENFHIDFETLSEYTLNLNGDKTNESKFILLAPKIEKHLQVCINCREEFELLNKELNEVDTYLSEKINTKEIIKNQSNLKGSISSWFNNNQIKYSFASAASIIFLFLLLYTVSEISTPKSIIIASSINKLDFSTTRGRNSSSFVNAVNELENKNYTKAINLLKEDISRSNNDVTLFYSYYILGITHIANAHSNFIGMFDDFDNNELEKAIMSFKKVLTLNNSGLFQNINYNSYYFLGQTYLLKGDIGKAKEYLTNAINYKSEYSSEANELLGTLE